MTAVSWGCFVLDLMELWYAETIQPIRSCAGSTCQRHQVWLYFFQWVSSTRMHREVSKGHRLCKISFWCPDWCFDLTTICPTLWNLWCFPSSAVQLFDSVSISTAESSTVFEVVHLPWWDLCFQVEQWGWNCWLARWTWSLSFCSSSWDQASLRLHRWIQLYLPLQHQILQRELCHQHSQDQLTSLQGPWINSSGL